jgi:hypothetical protein
LDDGGREIDQARRALRLQRLKVSDREDPFATIIRCTADPAKADKRTRSKWSRLMRYAACKPDSECLDQFITESRSGTTNPMDAPRCPLRPGLSAPPSPPARGLAAFFVRECVLSTEVVPPLAANMSAAQMIRCPDFARVVGADQQRGRKFDPERLGRFEVEGQLDSCGLLDRQIGWFLACVSCSTAIHSRAIQRARSTSQCRGNGQISSSTTVRAARGAGSRRTSHLPSRGAGKGLLFTPVRESSGQSLY